jgi:hypothetical protein
MNDFLPHRITKETELTIHADPHTVFPLLCPVREYEWIEPWQCRVRYSETGVAENNCIFETDFAHNGGPETWIVSRYEKDRCIEFVRFTADEKIIKLDIQLTGAQAGGTRLLWRKTFTGLSAQGNRIVTEIAGNFTPEAERIASMLNYYLSTGKMMSLADSS